MPNAKFQSNAQKERVDVMVLSLAYYRRVLADVAEPLVRARDQNISDLRQAALEMGMPEGVEQFVVLGDGVYWSGEGESWDQEKQEFTSQKSE